jgi:predicted ATPase
MHCTKGLEGLQALPDTPARTQQKLDLLITRATALQITKGYAAPDVGHAWSCARELCRQVGDIPRLYEAVAGLGVFYQNRGDHQTARDLGEHNLALAQRLHDAVLLLRAHYWLGTVLYYLGEFAAAHGHLDQASALPQQEDAPTFHHAPSGVPHLVHVAFVLWMLGYLEQALSKLHAMLTYARGLSHPYNLARALHYAATLYGLRREWSTAQEHAAASLALSTEQGFVQWVGLAMLSQGRARTVQGQGEAGIAEMRQGLALHQATGAVHGRSASLIRLAEAYGGMGQVEEGLGLLAEALAHVDTTGERYWEAELYRLKGELLLRQATPDTLQAAACFQESLVVARRQQAKSWELRATMSLSRLWQQQGKQAEAHELLAPSYGWFTEGVDTADLQEAKALLEELAG